MSLRRIQPPVRFQRTLAAHQTRQRTAAYRRSFRHNAMKRFIRILFFIACLTLTSRAEIPVGWSTNTNAISGNAGSKQPVLVFFTASWCQPCKLMSRLTLTNDVVKEVVTNKTHNTNNNDDHQD